MNGRGLPLVEDYPIIIFCRLNFSLMLSELPLETRICFTIYGCESLLRKPIGWVAMPLFNIKKYELFYYTGYMSLTPHPQAVTNRGTLFVCMANNRRGKPNWYM